MWIGVGVLIAAGAAFAVWRFWPRGDEGKTPDPAPLAEYRGPPWFRDVTSESGLHFTNRTGAEAGQLAILEIMGGGVALLDYNGDGLLDIFVIGGGTFDGPDKKTLKGHPCKLYKNLGGFKFRDVSAEVGLDRVAWWYTYGAAVADYDCDGWPDLLVTGYGRVALFRNEADGKGGRRFADVTEPVGLKDDSWSTSAGFADLGGDGFPEVYICHYVDWSPANHPACKGIVPRVLKEICPPQQFKPLVHALFKNEKGKAFRNIASQQRFKAAGSGLGVVLADLNDDGKPDIFVANDGNDRFLFFNRGGKLDEKGVAAGVAIDDNGIPNGSMGVDVADYDGSGRASLWVTNFQGEIHGLFQNLGRERFDFKSRLIGISSISMDLVPFGTHFTDLDNDGWEDLVLVNGHVYYQPKTGSVKQVPVLLLNVDRSGTRAFQIISQRGGAFFATPTIGRGLAVGDLDNDGWPDLVVNSLSDPVSILRNQAVTGLDKPNRWLGIKLAGKDNRCVVGSTVILEGNSRQLTRFAKGAGSYLSASDSRILFGLGPSEQVRQVTVKWSWGQTETFGDLEPNAYWELREGAAKAKRLPGANP